MDGTDKKTAANLRHRWQAGSSGRRCKAGSKKKAEQFDVFLEENTVQNFRFYGFFPTGGREKVRKLCLCSQIVFMVFAAFMRKNACDSWGQSI